MNQRIGIALILLTALLYVMACVQEIDERIEAGEFQQVAMQQKGQP